MIETPPPPVDVVPPCLGEAEVLPRVLDRIPPSRRALVVDNGSADGCADIARDLGAYVRHGPRHGFGAARHPGLMPATATATDVRCRDRDAYLEPALPPRVTGPLQRRRLVETGLSVRELPLLRDVDTAADAASVEGLRPPGSRFAAVLAPCSEVAR
ncbi:glycosyltransferase [Streptomyces canus]|uniref:glycosyltransferase n=1 Tax=Streptomyces canus TaxID=58343 RepID=UPI003F53EFAA